MTVARKRKGEVEGGMPPLMDDYGDEMNINDRLNTMSKEQLISLIKEIKITCESNRRKMGSGNNVFNFILNLIKGIL